MIMKIMCRTTYLQQVLVLLFSVEMSCHGYVTAKSIDGELASWIMSETVADVRVLADVQIVTGDTYDKCADLRVLRHVDAKQSCKVRRIVVLVQHRDQHCRGAAQLRMALISSLDDQVVIRGLKETHESN